jgi:hypothetical protein
MDKTCETSLRDEKYVHVYTVSGRKPEGTTQLREYKRRFREAYIMIDFK